MEALLKLPAAALLAAGLTSPATAGSPGPDCPAGAAAHECGPTDPQALLAATEARPGGEAPAPLWPAQAEDAPEPEAGGGEHTVTAQGVKFAPMIVYVAPGDTVHFENMPTHNVQTVEPLVPEGQEEVYTEIGENVSLVFDDEGIVVYKCTPHWGNRMGGIIVVGEPEDPAAIAEEYLRLTEEHPETLPARGLLKDLIEDLEAKGLAG